MASPALASEPKKKGGGEGYTQFKTINVFTAASRRRHGTMSVDMGLYSDDPKLVDQIKIFQPRLQDAYLSRLQAYAGTLNSTSVVDTDFIAMQLQSATDSILGRKGAKVLLGTILLN
ncbi:MAG: Tat pathway signal protein [Asticcacaulis sp.]|uniref:Tat pathway signal protein n=1 Tax=Asticcacaulis sp. TaxID=1872648 RepID=UPI0039E48538